jgi:hypothetical protein
MKKNVRNLITVLLLIILVIPLSAQAFSWKNIFNWGSGLDDDPAETEVLSSSQKVAAKEKLDVWERAYAANNLSLLLATPDSLTFSAAELNYILTIELATLNNPPIRDLKISFVDEKIVLTGYALTPLEGNVSIELVVNILNDDLYFYVQKARYKGFYIPKYFVGRLLYGQLSPLASFLFSDSDIKLRDIIVTNNQLELVVN